MREVHMEAIDETSQKIILHLVAAAKSEGVELSDKDSLNAFLDTVKSLVTSNKSELLKMMRTMANKDIKAINKKAARSESIETRMTRLLENRRG
jgi:hypothetical protein